MLYLNKYRIAETSCSLLQYFLLENGIRLDTLRAKIYIHWGRFQPFRQWILPNFEDFALLSYFVARWKGSKHKRRHNWLLKYGICVNETINSQKRGFVIYLQRIALSGNNLNLCGVDLSSIYFVLNALPHSFRWFQRREIIFLQLSFARFDDGW